jgi:hypothetical protein
LGPVQALTHGATTRMAAKTAARTSDAREILECIADVSTPANPAE